MQKFLKDFLISAVVIFVTGEIRRLYPTPKLSDLKK